MKDALLLDSDITLHTSQASAAAGAASTDSGMAKWRGRVALVTGSSSGIGSAVSVVPRAGGMGGDRSACPVCVVL